MAAFRLLGILSEVRRRRVFGVLVLYVVGAWVLLQVADTVFPGLDIPETSIRYVLIGTILGLPIALVFGWRFDITTHGIRRTPTAVGDGTDLSLKSPDYILLLVLSTATIAMAFVLTQKIAQTRGVFEPTNTSAELSEFDPPEFSIAVLPFDNLSSDPEQEYFVAGMQDTLIGKLARVSKLIVISRTSTLRYKETTLTIPEIARELNVAMIVEGSVFKSGDEIRINIQLIGSQPERHLLSEDYDRDLSRVLELQRDVTQDITDKIRVKLTEEEQTRFADVRRVNPQAYENFLKGQYFANQFTAESLDKAVTYFEKAIALDPKDALAYAGLARAYVSIGEGHGSIPANVAFPLAKEAADMALQLDETLAEAHNVLGWLSLFVDWDWLLAGNSFRRAIELQPDFANAHDGYAAYLQAMQEHDEAIREIYLAAQLDPLSPIIWADVAVELYAAKQYDRAITEANKALEFEPDFAPALWILGELYLQTGMHEKAIVTFQKASEINPGFIFDLAQAYARTGRIDEARAILDDAASDINPIMFVKMAEVFAELGEYDQAFAKLEMAYQERNPWLYWIRLEPAFDSLRSDPRYDDLVRRMNFPAP